MASAATARGALGPGGGSRRYVALLRGVNVGGRNKVAMAELQALFESLGYGAVETLLQSGNVLFSADEPPEPAALQAAVAACLGVELPVVLRSPEQLRRAASANPFAKADRAHLYVGFLGAEPGAGFADGLDAASFLPEEFAVRGVELYLHLPNGMGRARLPALLDRRLKVPVTIRNWATLSQLIERSSS